MAIILIAGLPGIYKNYENALIFSNLAFIYPPKPPTDAPFILSQLTELDFDLLLLPGGGDFSPRLYTQKSTLSASPDYITDLLQFQLLQIAFSKEKPILGICKGMQLLNVYFGGDLHPHLATADMHTSPNGDLIHPVIFTPQFPGHCRIWGSTFRTQALQRILMETPVVNSAHHQGIHQLGKHLLTIQYSEDFLPETIAHLHLPILGLQWHPERLDGFYENSFGKLIHLLLQS